MRFVEFCAGIGGFSLAAEWMGWDVIGQVEIDPWCRRVLAKHWPDSLILNDLREVKGDEWGTVDVVAGGIPCQPFSVAGKQAGAADDRHLWPEVARILTVMRPRVVVVENVSGFVRLALDNVLADLEAQGYACGTVVLPAASVGAPHRRERVWMVAYANGHRLKHVRSSESGAKGQALDAALASGEQRAHSPGRLVECAGASVEQTHADTHGGRREQRHAGERAIPESDAGGDVSHTECREGRQRPDADLFRGRAGETEQIGVGGGGDAAHTRRGDGGGRSDTTGGHVTDGHHAGWQETPGRAHERGEDAADAESSPRRPGMQGVSPLSESWGPRRGSEGTASSRHETQPGLGLAHDGLPGRLALVGCPSLYRPASARTRLARLGVAGGWDEGEGVQDPGATVAGSHTQDPRWQGDPMNAFGPDWEDGVPRVVTDCVDRTHKLKALGNALIPQVAYQIFQAIEGRGVRDA